MRDYFEPREVAAKTVVLREGEISRRVFYVAKGCLRVCDVSADTNCTENGRRRSDVLRVSN
jgi:CRP-like cAMP-binding protein